MPVALVIIFAILAAGALAYVISEFLVKLQQ
jgi:hypothetical protein